MKKINFEEITLREEISQRGGGIEISLDTLGFPNERMAAYQNYLGGGMLGRVCVNDTITSQTGYKLSKIKEKKLVEIGEQLKEYFFSLTNPDEDEWESVSFEQNQKMSVSAY